MKVKAITIPFESLNLKIEDIYLNLGYGGTCPPDDVKEMVADMIRSIGKVCRPSCCYIIKGDIALERIGIVVDGIHFTTGKIIASCMRKAESIAFFIATAGVEFEALQKRLHEEGDIWNNFLADAIGSEIAEATVRFVADELDRSVKPNGLNISNSYSPGYCGWTVKEQQKLFSLFPPKPCGVSLTDSSLMLPIKSVSGIIGLGAEVEKEAYSCDICTMKNCYKKRIAT